MMYLASHEYDHLKRAFLCFSAALIGVAVCGCSPTAPSTNETSDTQVSHTDSCAPDCENRTCGNDGCGGKCGVCDGLSLCIEGTCVATECTRSCMNRECGDDGCGGNCGTCPKGLHCGASATCRLPPPTCQPSCQSRVCGTNGCGGVCGECSPGHVCSEDGSCRKEGDPCGQTEINGTCDENTLIYCSADTLSVVDCGIDGVCTYDAATMWSDCAEKSCLPDCPATLTASDVPDGCGGTCPIKMPCETTTAGGYCTGSILTYCSGGSLADVECANLSLGCTEIEPNWFDCASVCVPDCSPETIGAPDGCGGTCENPDCPIQPRCNGSILESCIDGALETTDCNALGYVCAISNGSAFCADPTCTPTCKNREPGAHDGCGGFCPGAAGEPCGQITAQGQCVGNILQLCVGTVLIVDCTSTNKQCTTTSAGASCTECYPSCVNTECGSDGCGGSCGDCTENSQCISGVCTPMPCDGLTAAGTCDGSVLRLCINDEVIGVDCASAGQVCTTSNAGSSCTAPPCLPNCDNKVCGPDGCGGSCGQCTNGTCAISECVESGCGPVTEDGLCVGNLLLACGEDEQLTTFDCPEFGLICGIDPFGGQLDCVSSDACVPDCTEKSCGDDGCGGSCGTCTPGTKCILGACKVPCGDVTSLGTCQDESLSICVSGNLLKINCSESDLFCVEDEETGQASCGTNCTPTCLGTECGGDGCGGTCGDCTAGMVCQLGHCVAVETECGIVTADGLCEGTALKFCQDGVLYTVECSDFGGTCTTNPGDGANCKP